MSDQKIAPHDIIARNRIGQNVIVARKGQPVPAGFELPEDKGTAKPQDKMLTGPEDKTAGGADKAARGPRNRGKRAAS